MSSAPLSSVPEAENPWLNVGASGSSKISRKKNTTVLSRDSAAVTKSQAVLKKQLARADDALAREADDAIVEIDVDLASEVIMRDRPTQKGQKVMKKSAVDAAFDGSDDEDEDAGKASGSAAFKQRDLVALAFAGDNVVEVRLSPSLRLIEALFSHLVHRSSMPGNNARWRPLLRRRLTRVFLAG